MVMVLEQLNKGKCINYIRTHQIQLRHWRELPEYLKEHLVYDIVKMKDGGNETRGEGDETDWEG